MSGDAEQLWERARDGEANALERLLYEHYDVVRGRIAANLPASVRPTCGIEDVLQIVFAQVFREVATCRAADARAFLGWVLAIADSRVTDAIRHQGRRKRGGDRRQVEDRGANESEEATPLLDLVLADAPRASRLLQRAEALAALRVGLAALPEDQRTAIRLFHLEEHSVEETARAMDRSAASVRGLLQRGRAALRDALGRASRWIGRP